MAKSVEALVKPSLLVWARKSIGYDIEEVAKKLNISPEKITAWENGEARPTVKQLMKLADIYKRPLVVFYLPVPPNQLESPFDALDLKDWRKLPDTEEREFSTALRLEIRKSEERRELLLELSEVLDKEIGDFLLKTNTDEDPDLLARRIRKVLTISLEEQKSWKSTSIAYKHWIRAIELQNVLVFQTGFFAGQKIEIDEMRGLAISHKKLPIIMVNVRDTQNGRIFTLIHEFCHLLLNLSGIINSYRYAVDLEIDQRIEVFCNRFTAEFLVPIDSLLREPIVTNHGSNTAWEDFELLQLSRVYKVSEEVILRRLLDQQLTTSAFYEEKREEYKERFIQSKQKKSSGGPPPHEKYVRTHGATFVSTVFDAYHSGLINTNDVSDYLGARTKNIAKIEEHLMKETSI
ncbi:MAG: XRE family transcriptional regulator [Chloroflexi bacterium]|nr:XRE family transcriptional regulator [Chloroflexota bacterium]